MSIELETARLVLRLPRLADAGWMTRGLNNFNVAGNMLVPFPYEREMAEDYLGRDWAHMPPNRMRYVIDLKGTGGVGMAGFSPADGVGVLSYWLAEPYWGHGLMSEALRAVLGWYFAATGADRILAGAFHFNAASLAIQHKFGFAEIGRSNVHSLARNATIEHIDTELTREAFDSFTARADRRQPGFSTRTRSLDEAVQEVRDAADRLAG